MRIAKNYAVIKVQCERFNSTYARLNPALGFESRISKYISGAKNRKSIIVEKIRLLCYIHLVFYSIKQLPGC